MYEVLLTDSLSVRCFLVEIGERLACSEGTQAKREVVEELPRSEVLIPVLAITHMTHVSFLCLHCYSQNMLQPTAGCNAFFRDSRRLFPVDEKLAVVLVRRGAPQDRDPRGLCDGRLWV